MDKKKEVAIRELLTQSKKDIFMYFYCDYICKINCNDCEIEKLLDIIESGD